MNTQSFRVPGRNTDEGGGAPSQAAERYLSVPTRAEARHKSKSGLEGKGSQRQLREVFNRKIAEHECREYDPVKPLSEEFVRSVMQSIREHLYNVRNMGFQGRLTYKKLQQNHPSILVELRSKVGKHYRLLKKAEGQWAVNMLIQEALRRDRKYTGPRSASQSAQHNGQTTTENAQRVDEDNVVRNIRYQEHEDDENHGEVTVTQIPSAQIENDDDAVSEPMRYDIIEADDDEIQPGPAPGQRPTTWSHQVTNNGSGNRSIQRLGHTSPSANHRSAARMRSTSGLRTGPKSAIQKRNPRRI